MDSKKSLIMQRRILDVLPKPQRHSSNYSEQGGNGDSRVVTVHDVFVAASSWCPCRRFPRYIIAAMLGDEDERSFITSFCSSTSNCTLQHCYLYVSLKDGAYYCYCAYVLRISRYSDFLWVVLINTGIFLRGSKLCGESRT